MALVLVPPPPAVWVTYQESLADLLGPIDQEELWYHVPVGTLGLEDLAKGATLDDVVASGCRFFARWPDGSATSCEMTQETIYGTAQFRNYTKSDLMMAILQRIDEAQGLDRVKSEDFALHFLSIPGIYFEGLHLVCQGAGSDLILPVVSGSAEIGADAVMDGGDFLAAAGGIAAARLAFVPSSKLSS